MAIQALTPPQDITWSRMAFSPDMIDTNFVDTGFTPKWRSSLAVYQYVVPEEETADAYPNSRIVYLKFTCSITGWNPSEALRDARKLAQETGNWDDMQRTFWDAVVASGWAQKYWGCRGAIMQIAVYPNNAEGVAPDDYPYIIDFEPKKRELYESVSEGSEILSGSSDKTSVTKGSTSVSSTELSASAGFSVGGFGAGGSAKTTNTDTTVYQNTTDTSREARETLSRTTSSSQMYQLFNGYHLGTNRALFVVAPRPHTVSNSAHTEFNLIDGDRRLEGIQDVFLVVQMPRALDGFCIQASLDTGHQTTSSVPYRLVYRQPVDNDNPGGGGLPPPEDPPDPTDPVVQLVVTRRIVQACGTFDDNGNLVIRRLREPRRPPRVVGEIAVRDLELAQVLRRRGGTRDKQVRAEIADGFNSVQSQISRQMLDTASSVAYAPRAFEETRAFKSLVAHTVKNVDIPLSDLAAQGYLPAESTQRLARSRILTFGDLFADRTEETEPEEAQSLRATLIDRLMGRTRS